MKIRQILTPSATMWDALRNGGRFCCATKPPALRNGATFVAQQTSATPSGVQPMHPSLQFYYTIFLRHFRKPHFARKPSLFSKNIQNRPQNDCATVGFAETVESANIVGYNTVTLKKGYNMLAVNFQDVSSTEGISIQNLGFTLDAGLTGGANAVAGDQIQVYDAEAGEYTTYFLYNNLRQPTNAKNGKWCTTATGLPEATVKIKNGDSFWYLKRGDSDSAVTVSGSVSMDASQSISIVKGYNMIGSAFPANFNPNDLGQDYWKAAMESGAVGGVNAVAGDQLQVYDATAGEYTTYFLYNNLRQATNAKNGKWCTTGTGLPAVEVGAEVIPAGKGAWYLHRGDGFTLTNLTPLN